MKAFLRQIRLSNRDAFLIDFSPIFVIGLTVVSFSICAEDWPHWTGPAGQNVSQEKGLPAQFDRKSSFNIKWEIELGTVAFGAPTIANGRVYVGTNHAAVRDDFRFKKSRGGVVVCLDEATGETLWRLVSPERKEGFPFPRKTHMIQQHWGICSSPTVDGDRVYVVTNGADLLCLDVKGLKNGNDGPFQDEAAFMADEGEPTVELLPTDADILWRCDIPGELNVAPHDVGSCSVLIHGDVVYTSTSNGIGRGSPVYAVNQAAPAFIALDKYTGAVLAVDDAKISERLFHAQWASPSAAEVGNKTQILLGGGDGVCYAFETLDYRGGKKSSGQPLTELKTVWQFDCNPPHYKKRNGQRIYYFQGDERVYKTYRREKKNTDGFNSGDGSFVGISEILTTPVFYNDRVYVATGRDPLHGYGQGILHCIDASQRGDITKTGSVWSFEGIGRTLSTVAMAEGMVYAADFQGRVYCLDADTGKLYWKHDTGDEIWGNPLVADGKVYVNTTQSFWIFSAAKEKEVLFTARGGSESGPVVANGTVYAYIRGVLYAIARDSKTVN